MRAPLLSQEPPRSIRNPVLAARPVATAGLLSAAGVLVLLFRHPDLAPVESTSDESAVALSALSVPHSRPAIPYAWQPSSRLQASRVASGLGAGLHSGFRSGTGKLRVKPPAAGGLSRMWRSANGSQSALQHVFASAPQRLRALKSQRSLLTFIAGLQVSCFGCIGTAMAPALHSSGLEAATVALVLGRLQSASAFFEVMLSSTFGKLSDAIGRKPILLASPAICVLARLLVVLNPSVFTLLAVRFVTSLTVPIFWMTLSASVADTYGRNATELAVIGANMAAATGVGFAISSFIGGPLAAADIRYAYAASCSLGCCVLACLNWGVRETLPPGRRVPFKWSGSSPFAFVRLFRRGALFANFNIVVLLQSLTNGMGDLWQVLARELRGWGASQCGYFATSAGLTQMLGTLLTAPMIRRFGARGQTLVSTASAAASAAIAGQARTDTLAYGALALGGFGAGKVQAVSARITNLGNELGIPQGQLAAERNALNAILKVVTPSAYGSLFAFGISHGVVGLPFYATSMLLTCSALMAASIPPDKWSSTRSRPAAAPPEPQPNNTVAVPDNPKLRR